MTLAALVAMVVAPPFWVLAQVALAVRLLRGGDAPRGRRIAAAALPPWTPIAAWRLGRSRAWVVVWAAALAVYVAAWIVVLSRGG